MLLRAAWSIVRPASLLSSIPIDDASNKIFFILFLVQSWRKFLINIGVSVVSLCPFWNLLFRKIPRVPEEAFKLPE